MFFGKAKNEGSNLRKYFEEGLAHPYVTTPDNEALCEACESVSVFLNSHSSRYARTIALTNAGRLVGGMSHGRAKRMLTGILYKCCDTPIGEAVLLTTGEANFIYNGLPD